MAVYTEVSDEDLTQLIASYGLGELVSYKGIAEGVENTNYVVHTTLGTFILTLYERRVACEDLPFFLCLLEHLAARGVSCPVPVRNLNGDNLTEIAGRAAALVTFLDGFWIRRPRAEHCAAVGRALAGLHLAGEGFALRRANALGPAGWTAVYDKFAPRADEIAPRLGALISGELAHLATCWPQGLQAGVIHADLFPDNVFFLGGRLSGLIDFYFACNDALAYDLAVLLNAWCFHGDGSYDFTRGRSLLAAYRRHRELSDVEMAALPALAQGAALRFLLTRLYDRLHHDPNALVRPKDPRDFARRLRFHLAVKSPSEYGL